MSICLIIDTRDLDGRNKIPNEGGAEQRNRGFSPLCYTGSVPKIDIRQCSG